MTSKLWIALLLLAPLAGQEINHALTANGGVPSADSAQTGLQFAAGKTTDENPATGWISGPDRLPGWLRLEWRYAIEVRQVGLRPWAESPVTAVPLGRVAVEVPAGDSWREVAAFDAAPGADGWADCALPQPITTRALRFRFTGARGQVAISELRAMGPPAVLPADLQPTWQGAWIWSEPSLYIARRQPNRRYFRKSFELADPAAIREAWVAATAFDRLKLWVNNHLLLTTSSLAGGSMREATVKPVPRDWLLAGENVIAAEVDDLYQVGTHALLAELTLLGAEGRRVIGTDNTWKAQEDQGVIPLWRKPGFKDSGWTSAGATHRAGGRFATLWRVAHPYLAPAERVALQKLELDPSPPKPGATVTCKLTFSTAAPLSADYGASVQLGTRPLLVNHDVELWGAVAPAESLMTSRWQAGSHEVVVELPIPAEAPNPLPLTINLTRPEGAVGIDSSLPGALSDAYGLHLTVPIAKPAPTPGKDFPRTEVRTVNGAPTIHIDGRPIPPILWASSYGSLDRYLSYGSSGIKLFRPFIDGAPIPAPGEEEETTAWWLAAVDRLLSAAVSADPEVRLMPIITMDPHPQWLFDHPDEQMVSARGTIVIPLGLQVPDRGQVRPTFMSTGWRRDGSEGLKQLVTFLRGRPYAPNIIGLWFFAGRAGENYWGGNELNLFINDQGEYDALPREQWDTGDFSMAARVVFRRWLKDKYGTDEALRAAWRRDDLGLDDILDPARFRREEVSGLLAGPSPSGAVRDPLRPGVGTLPMDYYQCMSEAMIDSFASWGKAVKEASDNRLLTGCYYSYGVAQLHTHVPGFFGHSALARATRTPYLDGYSSPNDYAYRRAGQEVFAYNVTDSLRLHNKLHLYEYDSRTHLANIEPKTYSEEETVEAWKRDVANALARQSAWWWYEFADGQTGPNARPWFDDPAILSVAKRAKWAYEQSMKLPGRGPSAQIAVFYHGESIPAMDLFPPAQPINLGIIETLWHQLPRLGAPYDFYHLADLPTLAERGLLKQYRLCLFLNPFYLTDQERGWVESCRGDGRTLAWLWGPGLARADGPRKGFDAAHVAALTGLPGIRALDSRAEPTWRVTGQHALTAGLAPGYELAPRPLSGMWSRFGNVIGPLLYVDPTVDPETKVLGQHVLEGKQRADLGAFAVRDTRRGEQGYASVYFAVPTVPSAMLRNLARFAGVHLYRESDDLLYANAQFAAIHAGAQPVTGPLRLPTPSPVYDVFAGKLIAERTDTIQLDVKPKQTVLYLLAKPDGG